MQNSQRTQITLPTALRQEVDRSRRAKGESLSGYLQQAARVRLELEQARVADLKRLAGEVVGVAGKSAWQSLNASVWQAKQRQDRDLI